MKTIGLLGGMSWESTAIYYRVLNEATRSRLAGLRSAKVVLISLDFEEIREYQLANDWAGATRMLQQAALSAQSAGADMVLICTNTMHLVADAVQEVLEIPLLHIGQTTAVAVESRQLKTVGLLGTSFTMSQTFLSDVLRERGLEVLTPPATTFDRLDSIIFGELSLGQLNDESQQFLWSMIDDLKARGAEGVILGCTELEMLVSEEQVNMPVFPTARLHALEAVDLAI